ncbi:hypothetical protein K2224_27190 [Streptomyces sp. BHT-5-2]|uniref:hypothetical protein n=1 Tax=Streptomyces sp. BHT-5-2 TaxID=2866715 RepID=UPI001C8D7CC6|nr:hypothetical protein [Streptomyces sp. BHT-5-2]QZL06399.1 hypothetical protein K2224_27190 [Streptomyces sp. BHT-5-2]
MAEHIDSKVFVKAPLDTLWTLANSMENDRRHSSDGHRLVAKDDERRSQVLKVQTLPDHEGRSWSYFVERVMRPEDYTVYARRWGNPNFRYAHLIWIYREEPRGSSIRCVQDFELTDASTVDGPTMARIIRQGTEKALRATVEFVEEQAALS